jgi:hypothetical protein
VAVGVAARYHLAPSGLGARAALGVGAIGSNLLFSGHCALLCTDSLQLGTAGIIVIIVGARLGVLFAVAPFQPCTFAARGP